MAGKWRIEYYTTFENGYSQSVGWCSFFVNGKWESYHQTFRRLQNLMGVDYRIFRSNHPLRMVNKKGDIIPADILT